MRIRIISEIRDGRLKIGWVVKGERWKGDRKAEGGGPWPEVRGWEAGFGRRGSEDGSQGDGGSTLKVR
jgi:hypothetical protein